MFRSYILSPIWKVFFGVFSIVVLLLISPVLAFMTLYLFYGDTEYLEYLNPDLTLDLDKDDLEEGDHD